MESRYLDFIFELATWRGDHLLDIGQRQPLVLKLYSTRINLREMWNMNFHISRILFSWFRTLKQGFSWIWCKLCVEQNYIFEILDASLNMSFVLACQWRRHLNGANWLEQINIWSLSGRAKPSWLASYLSYLLRQEGVPWSEAVKLWLKSGDLWLLFASHCYSLVLLRDFPTVLDTFNYLYSTQGV